MDNTKFKISTLSSLFIFIFTGIIFTYIFSALSYAYSSELVSYKDLATAGLYDVTSPEFGADPTGKIDSTRAIQKAIDTAYGKSKADTLRGVVFFPEGNYLISNTLNGFQKRDFSRQNAVLLIGSTRGELPKIILKENSFNDNKSSNDLELNKKQAMIHIWTCKGKGEAEVGSGPCVPSASSQKNKVNQAPGNSAMQMSGGIRNLEFVIKPNNPDAIGIRFNGAQENILSNVKVTIEDTAFAGISGLIGTNSVFEDITIIGGKFGLYGDDPRWPSINNLKLYDQTFAAIGGVNSGGPVSINGFEIVKDSAPAISDNIPGFRHSNYTHSGGAYALSDGVIKFRNASSNPAVDNFADRQITMQNVFFENAPLITQNPRSQTLGTESGWTRVNLYANIFSKNSVGQGTYLKDGEYIYSDHIDVDLNVENPNISTLLNKHGVNKQFLPSPDVVIEKSRSGDPEYVYVADFGVTPLNSKYKPKVSSLDFTNKIKEIVKDPQVKYVLFPRGIFLISDTIELGENITIMGVSNFLTELTTHPNWKPGENTVSIFKSPNNENATTTLAFIKLTYDTDPKVGTFNLLHWQSGKDSLLYNVKFRADSGKGYLSKLKPRSEVLVTQNGGGRFFGINNAGNGKETRWYTGYRSITVDGTEQPLTIYGLNPEDAGYACTNNGKKCAIHPESIQVEIKNAKNVSIRGFKCEDYNSVHVIDSENIFVNGFGGCTDWQFENVKNSLILNAAAKNAESDASKDLFTEINNGKSLIIKRKDALGIYTRGKLPDFSVWDRNLNF